MLQQKAMRKNAKKKSPAEKKLYIVRRALSREKHLNLQLGGEG